VSRAASAPLAGRVFETPAIEEPHTTNRSETDGKFHHHFMSAFAPIFLPPKKVQTLNVSTRKLRAKYLYKKVARNMLVKLTPKRNWN
jgi:hypothetical protein